MTTTKASEHGGSLGARAVDANMNDPIDKFRYRPARWIGIAALLFLIAAVGCVQGMEVAVREAIAYGMERKAFGKPLMKFQVWKHKFVEHLTAIEAARRLTYFAIDKCNKDPFGATKEITMAKLFVGDLAQRVMYDCQQLFGGFGYVTEYPISRAWTDTRLITIGGGTSEIMKEILVKLEGL